MTRGIASRGFFGLCTLTCLICSASSSGEPLPSVANLAGKVLTVNGPIDPDELGVTITHEHLLIDFTLPLDRPDLWRRTYRPLPNTPEQLAFYEAPVTMRILGDIRYRWDRNRDNLIIDSEPLAIAEILEFGKHGGQSLVDATSIGLGRQPKSLKRIADATGIKIIMGSSWYRFPWHPEDIANRSLDSLTAEIVRDITVGVADTGIRAGIIGEVGVEENREFPLHPDEIKVLRASARASILTGAPLMLHTWLDPRDPPRILNIVEQEGVDLRRVIVAHADILTGNLPFVLQILKRGVYLEFDMIGLFGSVVSPLNDKRLAAAVKELIDRGYNDRLLFSQDVCTKGQLKHYGGNGYSNILEHFVPYLHSIGVTHSQTDRILIENAKRMLTFAHPGTLD